jgi:hypothetical protein
MVYICRKKYRIYLQEEKKVLGILLFVCVGVGGGSPLPPFILYIASKVNIQN